jgi:CheY-like chemotaxis protein
MSSTRRTNHLILVVDDDPDIRDSLGALLEAEGYVVELASNGQEALEYLAKGTGPPCLILLDLMMPVLDGHGFLRQRTADPALAAIPVVVITAAGEHRSRGVQASDVLPKPLDVGRLLVAVQQYC